jgi:threonine/homoserine/homoserine lactone efflux protein
MDSAALLWVFFLLVFGVVLLPGLDMAVILASALVGGRQAGFAAVAGVIFGGVFHVLMATTGIAVLLTIFPAAFNALLLAGALYIAWIGIGVIHAGAVLGVAEATPRRSLGATFRQAAMTNLLNPKAYVFMLAVFPQFLRPAEGQLWRQALALGLIIAATQAGVYGSLALGADRARHWLRTNHRANLVLSRCIGVALVMAAVWTGIAGWKV